MPEAGPPPAAGSSQAPAIVLVRPQLGENIGMAARAMLNCGLVDLRLVNPRRGWMNDKAFAAAAGATRIVGEARVFATAAEAVADLHTVFAATARPRHATQRVVTPRQAGAEMRAVAARGGRAGALFGPEARGLKNDDVALADAVLTVPVNPDYKSLNLAQSVLLVAYEWFQAGAGVAASALSVPKQTRPADKRELFGLFEHLERELDTCGFLRIADKRPTMVRNLRTMLQRAGLTEQEVRTLRGVIACLAEGPKKKG